MKGRNTSTDLNCNRKIVMKIENKIDTLSTFVHDCPFYRLGKATSTTYELG